MDWRPIPVESGDAEHAYRNAGGEDVLPWPVFAELLCDRSVHQKRLISGSDRRGAPVLLPLRHRAPYWEPMLTGVFPGSPISIGPGDPYDLITSRGGPYRLRYARTLPARRVTWRFSEPEHVLDLTANPENYWRRGGSWMKSIRLNRNRMRDAVVHVNRESDLDWLLATWHARWRHTGGDSHLWRERRVVYRHFAQRGEVLMLSVERDGSLLAAQNFLVRDGEMEAWTIARVLSREHISPGSLLYDRAFMWGHREGLKRVRMGVGFAYKARWAPPGPLLWQCTVANPLQRVRLAARRAVRRTFGRPDRASISPEVDT